MRLFSFLIAAYLARLLSDSDFGSSILRFSRFALRLKSFRHQLAHELAAFVKILASPGLLLTEAVSGARSCLGARSRASIVPASNVPSTDRGCAKKMNAGGSIHAEGRRRGVVRDGAAFVHSFGSRGAGDRNFNDPKHVCVDGDNHIISKNHRVVVVARTDGSFVRTFGSKGAAHGQFNEPNGLCVHLGPGVLHTASSTRLIVCVDGDDNIVVADTYNHRIQVFSSDGTAVLRTFGTHGSGAGQLNYPDGVCVDGGGNFVVSDSENHRIQQFSADGTFVRAFGSRGSSGRAQFVHPRGVCVDGAANIFVANFNYHRIQQFRSDGTFVRKFGSRGSGPAQFIWPWGVCVGADGALFVADSDNHRIHEYF